MTHGTPTEKLYLADPYTVSFEASVVSCDRLEQGGFAVVLDRSFFYPESGGQLADRGEIAGLDVDGVWEDESGRVIHAVPARVERGPAECRVDWSVRFDHMQQHTGQHILSRAFIDAADRNTISFHMGAESCTIDVDGPALDGSSVAEVERLANRIIQDNRDVCVRTVPPESLKEPLLRKALPDGVKEVRLVEVDGFDVIGCCGTHVRRSGEIGLVKVLRHERSKGANRVHFKAGNRALEDYRLKHDIVTTLAQRFTTSVDTLDERVEKMNRQAQSHRREAQRLATRLAGFEARMLVDAAEEKTGRCTFVIRMLPDATDEYLRLLSTEITKHAGTVALLAHDKGLVVCNTADDVDADLATVLVERVKPLGGSGGGKGGFATVRLPGGADVGMFLDKVSGDVRAAARRR